MTLNIIVIFNSITDISFLKYVTKIFCISYYFQGKNWECLKVQRSVAMSVYILSSKGANQLQVFYIRTLQNIQRNLLHGILFYWSCGPQMYSQQFFLENCRKACSGKLCLSTSYSWQRSRRDFVLSSLIICMFFVSYINQNHKDTTPH